MQTKPYLTTVADEATALLLENTAQAMTINFLGGAIMLVLIVLAAKIALKDWKKLHLAAIAASSIILLIGGINTVQTIQFATSAAQDIRSGKKLTIR